MNDEQLNEAFLAEWLAGTMSDVELRQRVSEADFNAYVKIRDLSGSLSIGGPDLEANYAQIRQRIANRHAAKKSATRLLYPFIAVAAAYILYFSISRFLAFSNSFQTSYGGITSMTLEDGSVVTLNAKSAIYYPNLFKYNRKIKLSGEAFFNVTKGGSFCVKTERGEIQVLGTKFNVIARQQFFEVICYEGKVKVLSNNNNYILEKGDAIRIDDQQKSTWKDAGAQQPSWITGESSFKNMPFVDVVVQLENQYRYTVQFPKTLLDKKISGTFPHDDINAALKAICLPLGLQFKITGNRTIIISE